MENILYYPAIFHEEEKVFWISFPDFPECFSRGETVEEAYRMAVEAVGLCIDEKLKANEKLPEASSPVDFTVKENERSILIECDIEAYRKKHNNKAIKKTLTIPEWLNEAAIAKGINFSKVLQDALLLKLEE